jgi:hypothetical protein
MLAEIISFGGYVGRKYERRKYVRLVQENDSKVIVRIIAADRNKDGKMEYTTVDSFEVSEAKPEEVYAVCKEAIIRSTPPTKK